MTDKSKTFWFYCPKTNRVFSDSIFVDNGSAYDTVLPLEHGPSADYARLLPDHTVERIVNKAYGIDTEGMLWFDTQDEAQAHVR